MAALVSSAVPWRLVRYAGVAYQCDAELLVRASRLRETLERFERTCTEPGLRVSVLPLADAMRQHAQLSQSLDSWVRNVGRGFEQADRGRLSGSPLMLFCAAPGHAGGVYWLGRCVDVLDHLKRYRSVIASLFVLSSFRAGPYAGTVIIDLPDALGTVLKPFGKDLWDVRHWAGLEGHTTWITATKVPFLLVTTVAFADLVGVLPEVVSGVRCTLVADITVARKVGEVSANVLTRIAPVAVGWVVGILVASAAVAAIPAVVTGAIVAGVVGLAGYYLAKWGTATILEAGQVEDRLASGIEVGIEKTGRLAVAADKAVHSCVDQASAWFSSVARDVVSWWSDGMDTLGRGGVTLDAVFRDTVQDVAASVRGGLKSMGAAGTRVVAAVRPTLERGGSAVDSALGGVIARTSTLGLTAAAYVGELIAGEDGGDLTEESAQNVTAEKEPLAESVEAEADDTDLRAHRLNDADPAKFTSCVAYARARRPDLPLISGDHGAYNYIEMHRNAASYYQFGDDAPEDLTQSPLRQGVAVVWDRGQAGADEEYGHVAIIEEVHSDHIVVSEANWGGPRRQISYEDLRELHFIL